MKTVWKNNWDVLADVKTTVVRPQEMKNKMRGNDMSWNKQTTAERKTFVKQEKERGNPVLERIAAMQRLCAQNDTDYFIL